MFLRGMGKGFAAVLVAAAIGGSAAACSSSGGITAAASSPSAGIGVQGNAGRPANPVPILRKTGAKQGSMDMVDTDIYGDRFATGSLGGTWVAGVNEGGEDVTVWTYSSMAAEQDDLNRNKHPSDGAGAIAGHLWVVSVVPVTSRNGTDSFPIPLRVIAARVGGRVVNPGS
jgi:hypothetical protein